MAAKRRKPSKGLFYWGLDYEGKLRRTWVMLPVCIIIGVIAPFYTAAVDGGAMGGIAIDVVLAVVWVAQFLYLKQKVDQERRQRHQPEHDGPASSAPGAASITTTVATSPTATDRHAPTTQTASDTQAGTQADTTALIETTQTETAQTSTSISSFTNDINAVQTQMADLALSALDQSTTAPDLARTGYARTAYVHAASVGGALRWNCFFRFGNALVSADELLQHETQATRDAFFARGIALADRYRAICTAYHVAEPTELRIIVDPTTRTSRVSVDYQPFDADDDPFQAWATQVHTAIAAK